MNFYPFHIGDYLSATRHLTWDEDAAYRRLLDAYYTSEKPLPIDERKVFRLVVASTEEQREAVKTVLLEFFTLTDEGWVNDRADREIAVMREKQQKQRDKANKRWHKPAEEHGNAPAMPQHEINNATASKNDADAMPPIPIPIPIPIPKEEQTLLVSKLTAIPKGFEEFWLAYPKKVGRGAAEKAWAKARINGHLSEVLDALGKQKRTQQWTCEQGKFIPHPSTWINERRWQDDPEVCVEKPALDLSIFKD